MDTSLFQFSGNGAQMGPPSFAGRLVRAFSARPAANDRRANAAETATTSSANLDLLRAFAVLLVAGFHLVKFFNWRVATMRVTDFGLLGVMFFFVHTTLVLMFSLERQSAGAGTSLFLPFMVRRCFRIYPLAILLVTFVFLFRIPSDLQFGGFHLLRQSAGNFLANLFLVQNVTRQKANPGVLWSLPLELQMYLVLPALFVFFSRLKAAWTAIVFWWIVVALWFATGIFAGVLPLSEGGIRSPAEALLKFTRFGPCFLPGIVAYKYWRQPRFLPAFLWPLFLALCCSVFLWRSAGEPVETGWFLCFAIGVGMCFFRESRKNALTRATKRIARYSYGIYKLDELPQLVNVLRGEMRFVGVRPQLEKHVEIFRAEYEELLQSPPGITDLATLTFRHEERFFHPGSIEEQYVKKIMPVKLQLALKYSRSRTPRSDLEILIRTVLGLGAPSAAWKDAKIDPTSQSMTDFFSRNSS
jgi:peptidoglycan/LPS O-acetylase OafA/YrhL